MIRRIAIAILALALPGMAGLLLLSRRPEIGPIGRPVPESFSAGSIAEGETLAVAGHCASCHTRPGGQPFAGGYGVNTPFGIVYGTNITPDAKTGIGTWSLEAFERAMREGVARDGSHLFPAFPYYAYTKLSDDDSQGVVAASQFAVAAGLVICGRRTDLSPFPADPPLRTVSGTSRSCGPRFEHESARRRYSRRSPGPAALAN
jgi:Cytochrome c